MAPGSLRAAVDLPLREEYWCRARAISSFPLPLSPVMRMDASLCAIRSTKRITARMRALETTESMPRNEHTSGVSPDVMPFPAGALSVFRSEEHTSELQSLRHLV